MKYQIIFKLLGIFPIDNSKTIILPRLLKIMLKKLLMVKLFMKKKMELFLLIKQINLQIHKIEKQL